jgi:hypothetical protein
VPRGTAAWRRRPVRFVPHRTGRRSPRLPRNVNGVRQLPRRARGPLPRELRVVSLPVEAVRPSQVRTCDRQRLRLVPRRACRSRLGQGLRVVPSRDRPIVAIRASGVKRLRVVPLGPGAPFRRVVCLVPQG